MLRIERAYRVSSTSLIPATNSLMADEDVTDTNKFFDANEIEYP
jgi:hypothetical protein